MELILHIISALNSDSALENVLYRMIPEISFVLYQRSIIDKLINKELRPVVSTDYIFRYLISDINQIKAISIYQSRIIFTLEMKFPLNIRDV